MRFRVKWPFLVPIQTLKLSNTGHKISVSYSINLFFIRNRFFPSNETFESFGRKKARVSPDRFGQAAAEVVEVEFRRPFEDRGQRAVEAVLK